MSAVFISYRRGDSAGHTGRLYDHLRERFGKDLIFRDIDTIEPGADFVDAVELGIKDCSTLIVVIGSRWLTAKDAGGRRLDDSNDFVRVEIASALKAGLRVIPVLVKGADMPSAAMLPENIAALARRHALELSDSRWDYDMGRLIDALAPIIEPNKPMPTQAADNFLNTASLKTETEPASPASMTTPGSEKVTFNPVLKLAAAGVLVLLAAIIWHNLPDKSVDTAQLEDSVPARVSEQNDSQGSPAEPAVEKPAPLVLQEPLSTQTVLSTEKPVKPANKPPLVSVDQQVQALLKDAQSDIAAQRLTTPQGSNALDKYKKVLQLDPANKAARKGIRAIAKQYVALANSSLTQGDLANAAVYMDRATALSSRAEGLDQVRARYLRIQQQTLRQQEDLAAQRKQRQEQESQQQYEAQQQRQESLEQARREEDELRKKEAQQQAREEAEQLKAQLKAQKASCLQACSQQFVDCGSTPTATNEKDQCQGDIKAACNKVQESCLGDPQIYILWGDLGAESECLGRWHQCMDTKASQCSQQQISAESTCGKAHSACEQACQI